MGEMKVLDHSGDHKSTWDPNKPAEVRAAKEAFERLIDEGYAAFEVTSRGKKSGTKVTKFDPDLGALIMVPEIAGG